jgi:hypothetical protein
MSWLSHKSGGLAVIGVGHLGRSAAWMTVGRGAESRLVADALGFAVGPAAAVARVEPFQALAAAMASWWRWSLSKLRLAFGVELAAALVASTRRMNA